MDADAVLDDDLLSKKVSNIEVTQTPIWRNALWLIWVHTVAISAGLYILITGQFTWQTIIFQLVILYLGSVGMTAGAHRLWSHRAYKAKTPLKVILAFCQFLSFQDSAFKWARDHRLHHKHVDTDADPHNSKRGFIFSHMGWHVVPKKDIVMTKLRTIDVSDLENDPIVMFQHKYYYTVLLPSAIVVLSSIPVILWDETFLASVAIGHLRVALAWHFTALINSAAHMWGYKPYDKSIAPTENIFVSIVTGGEGWHNYHHTFPWDYKASEYGSHRYNLAAAFIDFFAWIGWAYDLKSVPKSAVERRVAKTGDGTWSPKDKNGYHIHEENAPWGWGDKDISTEYKKITQITYSMKRTS